MADVPGLPPTDPKPPRDPAAALAAMSLLELLLRDPPGQWTDNRLEQSNHFRGIIFLAINALSEAMSGCVPKVLKRRTVNGKKRAEFAPVRPDHPLQELLEHPNPQHTFADWISQRTIQKKLTGTALTWAYPSKAGPPCQLWVIPTGLGTALPMSPLYPYGGWRVSPFGYGGFSVAPGLTYAGGTVLDAEQVMDEREYNPLYPWDGYSRLTAGGIQLDVLETIDLALKNELDTSMMARWMVTLKGAGVDEIQRVQSIVANAYGGARKAGATVVADADGVDLKNLQPTRRDADYENARKTVMEFCLALFGVPAALLMQESTSYAQLYASLQQFQTLTLKPLAKQVGEFLTHRLAWKYWGRDFKVELELPPVDDRELQMRMFSAGSDSKTHLLNEIRAAQNKPPLPDGDVLPEIYLAREQLKLQQEQQPPQPNAEMGGGEEPPAQPPGAAAPGGENADPRRSVVNAVLGQLTPNMAVEKSASGGKSGVFKDARGHRYRLQDGRRVSLGESDSGGGRHNPDLDAAFAESPAKGGKGGRSDIRHNPDLDAAFGIDSRIQSALPLETLAHLAENLPTAKRLPPPEKLPTAKLLPVAKAIVRAVPVRAIAKAIPPDKVQPLRDTDWGVPAKRLANLAGAVLGLHPEDAEKVLRSVFKNVARKVLGAVENVATGPFKQAARDLEQTNSWDKLRAKHGPKGPPSVPRPTNRAGKGTGVPKVGKAMSAFADAAGGALVPAAEPTEPTEPRSHTSTQIDLTGPAADALRELAGHIDPADLHEWGVETNPHVTALFGLHEFDPEAVREKAAGFGPVRLTLGPVGVFPGDGYDVVYASIDSPDLRRLRERLSALPNTQTHPNYVPHATVAYVQPGAGERYKSLPVAPLTVTADGLTVSGPENELETVKLGQAVVAKSLRSWLDEQVAGLK